MSEGVRTLVISPHSDDAAYSVGGAILTGFFPRPLLIFTPFTFSISGGYIQGAHDMRKVTALRAAEDEAFAKEVGARLLRSGLPEAGLSSKTGEYFFPLLMSASLLCGWPLPRNRVERGARKVASRTPMAVRSEFLDRIARFDRLRTILREQIASLLGRSPHAVLVSPLGLGNHPNHIAVASACRSLRKEASRLYFYEDLPYAIRYSLRGIERHVAFFDSDLRPMTIDVSDVIDDKIRNLSGYATQVGQRETEIVRRHAERLARGGAAQERIWTYPVE